MPAIRCAPRGRKRLKVPVMGEPVNANTRLSEGGQEWRVRIASAVKASRGRRRWPPCESGGRYVVSVALALVEGSQSRDLDNYIKPILDAVAVGLFCYEDTDIASVARWGGGDYDDYCFATLLAHRLPDAKRGEAGVAISVSRY